MFIQLHFCKVSANTFDQMNTIHQRARAATDLHRDPNNRLSLQWGQAEPLNQGNLSNQFSFSQLGGRGEECMEILAKETLTLFQALWQNSASWYLCQAGCETVGSKNAPITNLIPFLYSAIMFVLRYNCAAQDKTLHTIMLTVFNCKPHLSWKPDSLLA